MKRDLIKVSSSSLGMKLPGFTLFARSVVGSMLLAGNLGGCTYTHNALPADGPSAAEVHKSPIPIMMIDGTAAQRVTNAEKHESFARILGEGSRMDSYVVDPGDSIEISVWEAPPATLFGTTDPMTTAVSTAKAANIPEQMVEADGTIVMPFAGTIDVAGKTPRQIEAILEQDLADKANHPQILVRVTKNVTANATVMGDVTLSRLLPLTGKGERVLDALAMAGGVKPPLDKVSIQLSRRGTVATMPLTQIIDDPVQDVALQPGDVVTAEFQPNSFTALGAVGRNQEISFEAAGISLAQALGRIGGIQDLAANPKGLFLFRFEDPKALPANLGTLPHTPEGRVPVIYTADMRNPATFLVAQRFPIKDKDVIYVSTAPSEELVKFLNILAPTLSAAAVLITVTH
jgi:polysaccharide export outer membrane protein